MKLIVAGSRTIRDKSVVWDSIVDGLRAFGPVDEIVHGGARGVDSLADKFARVNGFEVTVMNAEWDKYGKAAGPKRNSKMANYGDALVAVWDGESAGTQSMINEALYKGLDVLVKQV